MRRPLLASIRSISSLHLQTSSSLRPPEVVHLAVGGQQRLRGRHAGDLAQGVGVGRVGQAGVQRRQRSAQRPDQHHIAIRRPPQQTVRPEVLAAVGIDLQRRRALGNVLDAPEARQHRRG